MNRFAGNPRIRLSPFYEATVAAGLTDVSVYNKMVFPAGYGDPAAEYERLVNGVAMWDVAVERQVQIEGPDADACAQYLCARDLRKMVEGQGKYVAMCDHDGEILNDPVLMKLSGNRYWISLADADMLLWCKAIAAEKGFDVKVTEPDVSPLAVQGPKAEDLIAEMFGEHVRELKYFWFIETELEGIPLVLCRSGWSKQGGFELFLQDGSRGTELWNLVAAAGEKYGIGPGSPNPAERIESGLLSFGGDTMPGSNPFEAGMARYVSLKAPVDYIGKEALKKIKEEGPEYLFVGLLFDEGVDAWPLQRRVEVSSSEGVVGMATSIQHSPRMGRTIAAAQIKRTAVEAGVPVHVKGPNGLVGATIHELPFI